MSILGIITIGIIGLIGYFVMAEALREFSLFSYPRVIAALVAAIGCIGLQQTGERIAPALLIPFAALLMAVGVVWGFRRLGEMKGKSGHAEGPPKVSTEPSVDTLHNPWRKTK